METTTETPTATPPQRPFFEWVRIKNFKSIKEITLRPRRINLLIGPPGGGKSSILQALSSFSVQISDKSEGVDYQFETDAFKTMWKYEEIDKVFPFGDISLPIETTTNLGIVTFNYFPVNNSYFFCLTSGALILDEKTKEIVSGLKEMPPIPLTSAAEVANKILQDYRLSPIA